MSEKFCKAEQRLLELGILVPSDIDLEAIAWDEGVRVEYKELQGCEARLVGFDSHAIVTIRKNTEKRRQRFSVAHELGHWNYHRGRSFECRADDLVEGYLSKPHEEVIADEYAAELLLPRFMFKPMAKDIKRPTFDGVKDLADEFNTSLTATAIRLVDMNVWPLFLVCHAERGRAWFKRSRQVPEKWVPQKELSPESAAFGRLFGNEERTRHKKVKANAWFGSRDAERYELVEDTIRLSDKKTLTILWIDDSEMLQESKR